MPIIRRLCVSRMNPVSHSNHNSEEFLKTALDPGEAWGFSYDRRLNRPKGRSPRLWLFVPGRDFAARFGRTCFRGTCNITRLAQKAGPKRPNTPTRFLQVAQYAATRYLPVLAFARFGYFCKSLFSLSRRAALARQQGNFSDFVFLRDGTAKPEKLVAYRKRRPESPPAGKIACPTKCQSRVNRPKGSRKAETRRHG